MHECRYVTDVRSRGRENKVRLRSGEVCAVLLVHCWPGRIIPRTHSRGTIDRRKSMREREHGKQECNQPLRGPSETFGDFATKVEQWHRSCAPATSMKEAKTVKSSRRRVKFLATYCFFSERGLAAGDGTSLGGGGDKGGASAHYLCLR